MCSQPGSWSHPCQDPDRRTSRLRRRACTARNRHHHHHGCSRPPRPPCRSRSTSHPQPSRLARPSFRPSPSGRPRLRLPGARPGTPFPHSHKSHGACTRRNRRRPSTASARRPLAGARRARGSSPRQLPYRRDGTLPAPSACPAPSFGSATDRSDTALQDLRPSGAWFGKIGKLSLELSPECTSSSICPALRPRTLPLRPSAARTSR